MGGAVALLLHRRDPTFWDGAVLVAPMCKVGVSPPLFHPPLHAAVFFLLTSAPLTQISEKVKPHPLVISLLTRVEEIIPKWKIVPTKDVIDSAFKDPVKREEVEFSTRFLW